MTCMVRHAHEYNSGSSVTWATNHVLLEIKVYFRGENVHLVWLTYSIIREFKGPEGKVTAIF